MNPLPLGVSILLDPASIVIRRPCRCVAGFPLNQVPHETPIVLIGSRIGGRSTCRVAARSGLRIEREYVVLPSWRSPSFVVEDNVNTLRWLGPRSRPCRLG